jgi:hypothetical protein
MKNENSRGECEWCFIGDDSLLVEKSLVVWSLKGLGLVDLLEVYEVD